MAGVYAGSSLLGYFGTGNTPVLSFARLNVNSGILAALLVVSQMMTGFSLSGMILTGIMGADLVSSISNRSS
jgi:hypothetical protein